jgi:hypothetical protein
VKRNLSTLWAAIVANKKASLLIAGAVAVLSIFYWFEVRPNIIRKECADQAISGAIRSGQRIDLPNGWYNQDVRDQAFEFCLRSAGVD